MTHILFIYLLICFVGGIGTAIFTIALYISKSKREIVSCWNRSRVFKKYPQILVKQIHSLYYTIL